MSSKKQLFTEWFIRIALSAGMLSAVADRFGFWRKDVSAWGNWDAFVGYTQKINPWVPHAIISYIAALATACEFVFGILLLTNFKTSLVALCTGILLLSFALAMTLSVGIKAPLDYSVFCAAASAFALNLLKQQKVV